jgi:hypothetical protein
MRALRWRLEGIEPEVCALRRIAPEIRNLVDHSINRRRIRLRDAWMHRNFKRAHPKGCAAASELMLPLPSCKRSRSSPHGEKALYGLTGARGGLLHDAVVIRRLLVLAPFQVCLELCGRLGDEVDQAAW